MSEQSREEEAAGIIDDLIVLFELWKQDFGAIDRALRFIAETKRRVPEHPVSVRVMRVLEARKIMSGHPPAAKDDRHEGG